MHCPKCLSRKIKKNGFTHYGKQNHRCKECGCQFVYNSNHYITQKTRYLIKKVLKEWLSIRGICSVFSVSLTWLMDYAKQVWAEAPDHLSCNGYALTASTIEELQGISIQIEEWTFVGSKANKVWLWITYDPWNRQVIAFYLGNRGEESAKKHYGTRYQLNLPNI